VRHITSFAFFTYKQQQYLLFYLLYPIGTTIEVTITGPGAAGASGKSCIIIFS
jgi:hypothetical protein